jgi:uncharacterized coiled-coil protein SlyX
MRRLFLAVVSGAFIAFTGIAVAQAPPASPSPGNATPAAVPWRTDRETGAVPVGSLQEQLAAQQHAIDQLVGTVKVLTEKLQQLPPATLVPAAVNSGAPAEELQQAHLRLVGLAQQQAAAAQAPTAQDLQKQLELQQKQIDVLEKMIKLLAEQLGKQAPTEKLEGETATLEARSQQAARRDQELAHGLDNLTEHVDAMERYGPALPGPLKQLFDPFYNNENPLSIYGALVVGYDRIHGNAATAANGAGRPSTPGGFYFGEFTPDFFLKLNDWILLEAEIGLNSNGSASVGAFAQADFFLTDWLTISAGRFISPLGFFNQRLGNPWTNKLPTDTAGGFPLVWLQVLPTFSMLGIDAQGSFYLGNSPFKLDYHAFVSNGLNVRPATAGAPTINELANLENMTGNFSTITNDKIFGGRIGLWWPEKGLEAGVGGLYNGDYVAGGFEDSISILTADLNYHMGNWDLRAEYGVTWQQVGSFAGTAGLTNSQIRRQGFYAQVAYRPYDCPNRFLQKLEGVYRYSYVDFHGIDATQLDLTTFASPIDVPVRRQQNEFGINYWFYQRMVLKFAYQINDEPGFHLHDNQFITELAWGW